MDSHTPKHRVQYDKDGNIILGTDNAADAVPEQVQPFSAPTGQKSELELRFNTTPAEFMSDEMVELMEAAEAATPPDVHPSVLREEVVWVDVPEEPTRGAALSTVPQESVREPAKQTRSRIHILTQVTKNVLDDGREQYAASFRAGRPMLRALSQQLHGVTRRFGSALAQPVWVPGRKKTLKQYSRGTLFLVDIVRFGGTFAGIFAVLFIALNFQSFWEITSSKVASVLAGPTIQLPASEQENIADALAGEARKRGELMSYLPNVGPPDNRIIVPKLGLNVPMVTPEYDALLRQDWAQVEVDIQEALQNGVVHYPGTARPGQAGNFFVTGHSSYYPFAPGNYKTVFARLHELEPGDEYFVYYHGDKHRYVVRTKKEVLPSDVTVLDQPAGKRIATMMTCTPIGTTLRRLIVQAEEVDLHTGIALRVGEHGEPAAAPAPKLEALPI